MSSQLPRATRVRAYLDETIASCEPGTRLFTHELATALCIKFHHGESTRDVGMALRERDDVRMIKHGIWEKI